MAGGIIVACFIVIALAGPVLAPQDPLVQDLGRRLSGPTRDHLFGRDSLGRDVLTRVIYGARISLVSGTAVVLVATAFGIVTGMLADRKSTRLNSSHSSI